MKVGETPGNGEESPTFREEPDNYGFEDKRGGTEYADWDEAYEKYIEIARPYLTEEELEWLQ